MIPILHDVLPITTTTRTNIYTLSLLVALPIYQGGKGQPRTGRVESCLTLHSVFSLIVMRRSRAEHPPLPTTSAGGLTPARPRRFNVVPTTMPASPGTRPRSEERRVGKESVYEGARG